ncbi:FolE GTP cyclohydrolase I [uncultured Caudovirales phage]|uniref:GTP cyclohydrolase I n=1 Tax=uncultured Caudovirales phage TaxID=2100421 RepID=A0A6J5TAY6_9CAUD|nr:FolE GTP cyclohydrolase I [uncultured Caudovirales phage]CAB4242137.1 FolE GTP cyclohydrolase I [uncultured Caudovirales phage]
MKHIVDRIKEDGGSYFANDNISQYLEDGDLDLIRSQVQEAMDKVLEALVIDVDNDHNTKGTAKRVAKMYVDEVFKGRFLPAPAITDFPNAKDLDQIYTIGPITVRSACSHHLVPIMGQAWIGVIPSDRVIGISKFNRLTEWVMTRPQIQEEAAVQLADEIESRIKPLALAVIVKATHMCMTWRGVREPQTSMTTSVMRGLFREDEKARNEFLAIIKGQGY